MYNLVSEGVDPRTGEPVVRRQALRFGDGLEEHERGAMDEDWIQINVHRIEHKKRIRELQAGLGLVDVDSAKADGLRSVLYAHSLDSRCLTTCRWTNSGLIEPGMRPKRYKYQLLDPVDMPYAAFRFYCRPYGEFVVSDTGIYIDRNAEYLEEQGIVRIRDCTSPCSSMSSIILPISGRASIHGDGGDENPDHTVSSPSIAGSPPQGSVIISPMKAGVVSPLREQRIQSTMKASESFTHIPLSDSDDSLSVRTKDSIEDLPSSVPRSPRSSRSSRQEADVGGRNDELEPPPSPTRSPGSTRQRLKKKLTVQINGADFDIERKKRPLSPFTSGGVLRKASLPQTAPAAVTEFGPTVEDEVRAKLQKNKADESKEKTVSKTTSAERGGKRLMGFLGRRTANQKTT